MAVRIQELRRLRDLSQEEFARRIGITRRVLSTWEGGRDVPADEIPKIATALGVTIQDFYSDEQPQLQATLRLAEQLAQVMGVEPGRVEVNVYPKEAADSRRESAAAPPSTEFVPTRADRDTRDILRAWPSMTEAEQQEWLDFADEIRRERGDQS